MLREGATHSMQRCCAVLASFAVESPLTGFGAGGFMLVHSRRGERTTLLDFFVEAGGRDRVEPAPSSLRSRSCSTPRPCRRSTSAPPRAACRAPRRASSEALRRFGTMPPAELLVKTAVELAREGVPVSAEQAYMLQVLEPIHVRSGGTRELYAPGGGLAARGRALPLPGAGRGPRTVRWRRPRPYPR